MKTLPLAPAPAKTMKKEYSGLECTVEVVRTTEEAIDHIHKFGSSHTDVIITDNGKNIVLNLMPHSHQSLSMFKSCFVKHSLIFFFFIETI